MKEPCKLFSVVLPFEVYEKLKAVSRADEISVGELVRRGVDLLLHDLKNDGVARR